MEITNQTNCLFCIPDKSRAIIANVYAMAIYDGFPVTPGHTVIVPKRHITSFSRQQKKSRRQCST